MILDHRITTQGRIHTPANCFRQPYKRKSGIFLTLKVPPSYLPASIHSDRSRDRAFLDRHSSKRTGPVNINLLIRFSPTICPCGTRTSAHENRLRPMRIVYGVIIFQDCTDALDLKGLATVL
ncbi:hypothetical protein AG1IA_05131 [Rhizoctonia solani AG-1 IA]|uniref:Uncharacterized protein n=1 Tax=Thanatephorus cucumeris (strain AG1-IA) TaxID=983506 RepID=L8WVQ6_THACA|nr:hypothetical protein AG1IA_05131 [Rhizoctonia solani AG-1 IA]